MTTINKLHVSTGNTKMGKVASVSLPPLKYCYHCKGVCDKDCYALKSWRLYKSVRKAWGENDLLMIENIMAYGDSLVDWLTRHKSYKLFRWHVSGDIPNYAYLKMMCDVMARLPHITSWAFTKNYEIVNEYLDNGEIIPDNLTMIFSNWGTFECYNPHNLPQCVVIESIEEFPINEPGAFLCGGDCQNCTICRNLKRGHKVYIIKH